MPTTTGSCREQCREAGRLRRGRVLAEGSVEHLELPWRRAFTCRVRRDGRRQDGDQGRLGPLRSHARDSAGGDVGSTATSARRRPGRGTTSTATSAYEAGEVNLDPNGPDFVSIAGPQRRPPKPCPTRTRSSRRSTSSRSSLERELMPNFAVRVTGIYSRTTSTPIGSLSVDRPYEVYNIPDHEPGPGARRGGRDGRRSGDVRDVLTTILLRCAGASSRDTMLINDPGHDHTYKSFEIAAQQAALESRGSSWRPTRRRRISFPVGTEQEPPSIPTRISTWRINTWEWLFKMSGAFLSVQINVLGQLRAPEREPPGADGAVQGRSPDSVDHGSRRALGSLRLPHLTCWTFVWRSASG